MKGMMTMKTTTLRSEDISCGGCANSIKNSFAAFPGVVNVSVNVDEQAVTFEHEETVSEKDLAQRLGKAGFSVSEGLPNGSASGSSCHL